MKGYPVTLGVDEQIDNRNRLTTAFRAILALPHMFLVGGAGSTSSSGGVLTMALAFTTVLAWFVILFTGRMPERLWTFAAWVLGWQYRVGAYSALLRDEYPPFGDPAPAEPYPARFVAAAAPAERSRLTVFFRPFMLIPHLIVLLFVAIGAGFATVFAWFAILFTGRYPGGVFNLVAGTLAWAARVGAYAYLLTDEYPPFSLDQGERGPELPSAPAIAAPTE